MLKLQHAVQDYEQKCINITFVWHYSLSYSYTVQGLVSYELALACKTTMMLFLSVFYMHVHVSALCHLGLVSVSGLMYVTIKCIFNTLLQVSCCKSGGDCVFK